MTQVIDFFPVLWYIVDTWGEKIKITRTKYDTLIATILIFFTIRFLISLFSQNSNNENSPTTNKLSEEPYTIVYYTLDSLPEYSDDMRYPYVYINNNKANFGDVIDTIDLTQPFESYSELDRLGRCGTAIANIVNLKCLLLTRKIPRVVKSTHQDGLAEIIIVPLKLHIIDVI